MSWNPRGLLAMLVTGCSTPDPASNGGEDHGQGTLAQTVPATPVSDPSDLPVGWTGVDGYTLDIAPRPIGDVTGDGIGDAEITVWGPDDPSHDITALIVAGPLNRNMTLPGDEVATVRDYYGMTFGDADGDGVVDVQIMYGESTQLLLGPLSGALDKQAGLALEATLVDVDLDGILDLTFPDHTYLLETRIVFGPMSRWQSDPTAQKPDLTLDWACDDPLNPTSSPQELNPVPDLDGDGRVDLWTGSNNSWPFGWCWGYVFSLPASGEVAMIGQARGGFIGVGDQNGDGSGDFVTHDPLGIGLGPVTFGSTAPIGSEPSYVLTTGRQIDIDPALQELSATVVDWTGDGVRDLLATVVLYGEDGFPTDIVLVPVEGGAAGLAKRSYPQGWHSTSTGPVFVEDGTAYVLSPARDNRVVLIPIGGPATVVAHGPTISFGQ